jgi:YD repeat-containing protein
LPSTITANTVLATSPCPTYLSPGTTVNAGVTLTVNPGVTIMWTNSRVTATLTVLGALQAVGTATAPITFTNTYHGASSGNWGGVTLNSGATATLRYVAISNVHTAYASTAALTITNGSPSLSNLTFSNDPVGLQINGGTVNVAGDTFTQNAVGLSVGGGTVSVTGTTFLRNTTGIQAGSGSTLSASGNTFTGNTSAALALDASVSLAHIGQNTYSGNAFNGITITGGTVRGALTWQTLGNAPILLSGFVDVPSGNTLTLAAGLVVDASRGAGLSVEGTLQAMGTATAPIRLTSGMSTSAPGAWSGITLNSGAVVSLSYVTIAYASAGLSVHSGSPSLGHLTLSNNQTGIQVSGGTVTLATGTSFVENTVAGLAATGGTVSLSGVSFTGNTTGLTAADGTALTVGNCTFLLNTVVAAKVGLAIDLTKFSHNTFSGNAIDGVAVAANGNNVIARATTWPGPGDVGTIDLAGFVQLAPTATLTVDPGAIVLGEQGGELAVQGTLTALGTISQPITFTSAYFPPLPGDWAGISAPEGATIVVRQATIGFAQTALNVYYNGSNTGASSISIENSAFYANAFGVTNCNGCTVLDATHDQWQVAPGTTLDCDGDGDPGDPNEYSECSPPDSFYSACDPANAAPFPLGDVPAISYSQQSVSDPATNTPFTVDVPNVNTEPYVCEEVHDAESNGLGAGSTNTLYPGAPLPGSGNNGSANASMACVCDPVNTADGSFGYSQTDLTLGGRVPLVLARSYNSITAASQPGPLGYGWSFTYEIGSVLKTPAIAGTIALTFGSGRTDVFTRQADGSYRATVGQFDTLTMQAGGAYDVRDRQQRDYHFAANGTLQSITDRNGNVTTLTYTNGRLSSVSAAGGRQFTFAYNTAGLIASVSDNSGRTISFTYSAAQDLIAATDPLGHTTRYTYDGGHQMISIIDHNGHTSVTNVYDTSPMGRVIKQTDAAGKVTTFAYFVGVVPIARVVFVTDPRGGVTEYSYDVDGLLVSEVNALGGTTAFTYDARGNRLTFTDPNGHTTTDTYDNNGNLLTQTDPLGRVTTVTYDAGNQPLTVVDPLGQITRYTYDAHENVRSMTDPAGKVTTYTYDGAGDPLTATDPLAHTTTMSYDSAGDLATSTGALANTTTFAYDGAGRLTAVTDPLGHSTTATYDGNDDVLTVTDPLTHTTTTTYDAEGNQLSVKDPLGHVTRYMYDALNRPVQQIDALGKLRLR